MSTTDSNVEQAKESSLGDTTGSRLAGLRRYSLFSLAKQAQQTLQQQQPPAESEASVGQDQQHSPSASFVARQLALASRTRRTSSIGDMMAGCQRCRQLESQLVTAMDNLNEVDSELKASRQVISLLQRQLELSRAEKEAIEKLANSRLASGASASPARGSAHCSMTGEASGDVWAAGEAQHEAGANVITPDATSNLDEQLVKLNLHLKETQNYGEQLSLQTHMLEEQNAKLKAEIKVLNETLALRNQTVASLSIEVYEQTAGPVDNQRRQSTIDGIDRHLSLHKAQRQIAKLTDTNEAYKKTNELLSNNVMSLSDRLSRVEEKEIEARSQSQELEAKCCQIQSKLLSLLKEIEQSSQQTDADGTKSDVIASESVKLLIKRLLEDKSLDIPLSWKEGNSGHRAKRLARSQRDDSKFECDELGFYVAAEESADGQRGHQDWPNNSSQPARDNRATSNLTTVEEAVEALESIVTTSSGHCAPLDAQPRHVAGHLQARLSVDATKNNQAQWHLRWDDFIKDFDRLELRNSRDFKLLLRSGVPQEYRCKVWKTLVELKAGKERAHFGPDYYQSLLEPNRPPHLAADSAKKQALNPSSKQIELDLLRTLPNNKHFENLDSSGTVRLRRVLNAYAEHNPIVGYCQGMNRLAAVALLILPEEEAFWCLATIVDHIMPHGYYNDLWLAQVDSCVVMEFVAIKMPTLSEHMKRHSIDLSLFAWFLTIFVDGTPPALFLRLWDCFLYEGDKILFRIALALLKMHEQTLLELSSSVTANNFLRSAINTPLHVDRFFEIAFDWVNPLSSKSLRSKRMRTLQQMRSVFEAPTSRNNRTPECYKYDSQAHDDSAPDESSIISI